DGWAPVGKASATVASGVAWAALELPRPAPLPAPALLAARFEKAPSSLAVTAHDLDGTELAFVVERLDGEQWVEAGSGKAKVAQGRAVLELPSIAQAVKPTAAGSLVGASFDRIDAASAG